MPSLFAGHPYPTAVDVFVATKTRCSLTGIFNIGIIPHTHNVYANVEWLLFEMMGFRVNRALVIHIFLPLQGRFCYIYLMYGISCTAAIG